MNLVMIDGMRSCLVAILFVLVLYGCDDSYKEEELKGKTEALFDSIASGNPYPILPNNNFPKQQTKQFFNFLQNPCDFSSRKGGFVNSFYKKRIGGSDELTFIYEFYLECDSMRILVTHLLKDTPEIKGIHVEDIEKENKMILKPKLQLPVHN